MVQDQKAILVITVILLILVVLTVTVLAIAFFSRWRLSRREARVNAIRERLSELIISFISGDLSIEFVKQVLNKRMDYIVMMTMIQSLGKSLEGTEEERLQELMDVKSVQNHFMERLESGNPILQAKACLYFSRKRRIRSGTKKTLIHLTSAREPVLVYAASRAVIVHGEMAEKEKVLRACVFHEGLSDMAVSDLFVTFTEYGDEYHQEEMLVITGLILGESLLPKRKALLIRILDELEYFHSVDFLTNYYRNIDKKDTSPLILVALIRILTKFGVVDILSDLHQIFAVSEHVRIREAAAWSMGFFLHPDSRPYLQWLINDRDFRVRFQAVKSLCGYPDIKPEKIRSRVISEREMDALIGEITGGE